MKKLIAIAVVFVLVAGAVFADVGIGGQLGFKVDVAKGDNVEDSDIKSSTDFTDAYINANLSGDSFGGMMRILAGGTPQGAWWAGGGPFAFLWWKPIEQLKIQIGRNMDSDWGAQAIGGWGYNAEAQNYVAVDNWVVDNDALDNSLKQKEYFRIAREAGFYGGYNGFGVGLSIYPADGVAINIGLPFGGGDQVLYKALAAFHLNAGIQIGDAGKLNVSFKGGKGFYDDYASVGNIYASFYLTQIENLGVDVGLDFPLPYKDAADKSVADGLRIGLGVQYEAGDFGIKFRAGVELPKTYDGDSNKTTSLGFGILPSFNLAGAKAFLNAGLSLKLIDDESITGWFVNPYVLIPANGLRFYVGLQIFGEAWSTGGPNAGDPLTKWALPIGFQLYF